MYYDRSLPPGLAASRADDSQTANQRLAGLQRLLPLWPAELSDTSIAGRERIVALLARALRQERLRGRRGHWAYDLARHATLARLHRSEAALLASAKRAAHHKEV